MPLDYASWSELPLSEQSGEVARIVADMKNAKTEGNERFREGEYSLALEAYSVPFKTHGLLKTFLGNSRYANGPSMHQARGFIRICKRPDIAEIYNLIGESHAYSSAHRIIMQPIIQPQTLPCLPCVLKKN